MVPFGFNVDVNIIDWWLSNLNHPRRLCLKKNILNKHLLVVYVVCVKLSTSLAKSLVRIYPNVCSIAHKRAIFLYFYGIKWLSEIITKTWYKALNKFWSHILLLIILISFYQFLIVKFKSPVYVVRQKMVLSATLNLLNFFLLIVWLNGWYLIQKRQKKVILSM